MKIRLYDDNKLKYALNLTEVEKRVMFDVNVKEEGRFNYTSTTNVKNYIVVYSDEEITFKISQLVGDVVIDNLSVITWTIEPPTCNTYTYLQVGNDDTPEGRMVYTGAVWFTKAVDISGKTYHNQIYRGRHFIIPLIDNNTFGMGRTSFQLISNTMPVTILQGYDEES